ncbi:porin [Roseovarius sp. D22-M7]|uniref:porin n=1 Tax=Roseovarius sp. D22-M7 TaxID=3127116 RepID=UPI003010436B
MKKQLLSTSAIALGVAMAAPASAQQWDVAFGGFVNTHVGASDVDLPSGSTADLDGVNVFTNSEIIFQPSVTLDNGLTFGVNVQLEALNAGSEPDDNEIDESYAYMESDTLGRVEAGSHNSAGYLLSKGAPTVGSMAINSPSISAFVPFVSGQGFRQAGISSYTEVAGNNDVQRISYFTPSFNGLTVGVSYAPSSAGNASNNAPVDFNSTSDVTDIFDIGVAYDQSYGGVDVGLSARWGTGNSNFSAVDDPTTWSIGANLGVNAFTFGGSYGENDNGGAGGVGDNEGFSLGVAYDIVGPWSVGLETYQGELKTALNNSDYETYKLAASRDLGPGVSWDVYYAYVETNNGAVAGNPKVEGNVLATAINLSF